MTLPDPAWRQRTRPCPFFSQGRCLFSDSCNFLHDIKVKSDVDHSLTDANLVENRVFSPPKPVFNPPSVVVNSASPRSTHTLSTSPTRRSPRLSGLLLALQDVLGPTNEVHVEDDVLADADAEDLLHVPSGQRHERSSDFTFDGSTIVENLLDDSKLTKSTSGIYSDSTQSDDVCSDGLSDEEDSLELPSYVLEDDSFQSEADDQHTLTALNRQSAISVYREDNTASLPDDERVQEVSLSLLSPVQLSARLRPFSLCSPPVREDSIDSGYADSWTGPLPLTRSPPHSARSSAASFRLSRASLSFPVALSRRTSYDVRAIRPSPHNVFEPAEDDVEENDAASPTLSIFDAYDVSPVGDDLELEETSMMELEQSSPTMRFPSKLSVPTSSVVDHDSALDAAADLTFESSRHDASFKTALSTAPSSEDLTEDVSTSRRDSLFSVSSRPSSRNTSLLSAVCGDSVQPAFQDDETRSLAQLACDDPARSLGETESVFDVDEEFEDAADVDSDVQAALGFSMNNPLDFFPHPDFNQGEVDGHSSMASIDLLVQSPAPYNGTMDASRRLSDESNKSDGEDHDLRHSIDTSLQESTTHVRAASEGCATGHPMQRPPSPLESPIEDPAWTHVQQDCDVSDPSDVSSPRPTQTNDSQETDVHPVLCSPAHQRDRAASDITIKGASTTPPPAPTIFDPCFVAPSPDIRRARAASDLTVTGRRLSSPTPQELQSELPIHPPSPTPTLPADDIFVSQELCASDTLQSLYDRYLDAESLEASRVLEAPGVESTEVVKEVESTSPISGPNGSPIMLLHTQNPESSHTPSFPPLPDSPVKEPSDDAADASCAPSSHVFVPPLRPLALGQGRSSSEAVDYIRSPSNHPDDNRIQDASSHIDIRPSPTPSSSSRILTKEIGSTKIPFGFKRRNPQFAARNSVLGVSQPLRSAPPSQGTPHDGLRIRTDVAGSDVGRLSFSASNTPSADQLLSPDSVSEAQGTRLKPLRLSTVLNQKSSLSSPALSMSSRISIISDHIYSSSTPQSPSVSSSLSLSHNPSLSSSRSSIIPEHNSNTLTPANDLPPLRLPSDHARSTQNFHLVKRDSQPLSAPITQAKSWRLSHYRAGSRNYSFADSYQRTSKRLSTLSLAFDEEDEDLDENDQTICRPISAHPDSDFVVRPGSVICTPAHAIATPKPTLLFAIASDDVEQVRRVLESGDAGPNDQVGPQSALAFALTNDNLAHKNEIVKALLAYGADPSALRNPHLNPSPHAMESNELSSPNSPPLATTLEGMDPATRYYVSRADAAHTRQTSQLIHRSFFRPLTRVRYDLVGQDRALEQLFRVLSMHSQRLSVTPIVVLLCGPSGHGKSLLARK
ncbi:hypothetical protein BV22DRAFT_1191906, partial [Leucogyrophana mollusca]